MISFAEDVGPPPNCKQEEKMMKRRGFLKIGLGLAAAQVAASLPRIGWAAEKAYTVGQAKAMTMIPNIVAAIKKCDADFGIKIEPKVFSSGVAANEAMLAGHIDAALSGDTPSLSAFAVGAPIKTVMIASFSGDVHTVVAGPGSGIAKMADLKGKKIGGTVGTGPHRLLFMLLEKEGIADTIQFFNMKIEDIAPALATKQIDAAMGWEPWPTLWEKRVGAKVIARGGKLVASAMLVNLPEKLIREQRESAYRIVLALSKAQQYIRTGNRKEIVDAVSKYYKMDEEEVSQGIQMLKFDPRISPYILQDLKENGAFMVKIKKLDRVPDLERFMNRELLERAMKEQPQLFKDLT
jgi:sulfonate transport system substrate-binding protein